VAGAERRSRRGAARAWREWPAAAHLDPDRLEPGDCLLAWGPGREAVRYCHFAEDAELEALLSGLRARTAAAWTGEDGRGTRNRYFALAPA